MNDFTYLLLQARNADDPMRRQEVRCFARALGCEPSRINAVDLLEARGGEAHVTDDQLRAADVVLFGGSGDYSVAAGGEWMPAAMHVMRKLVELSKPTFASCWGFQAMAEALGGRVVTDNARAELGTLEVTLTDDGRADPVFGAIGDRKFVAAMGHKDIVDELPPGVTLLASSPRVVNQAFRVDGKPIYCTQFHPELDRASLMQRLETYPSYVADIAGVSLAEFAATCVETPAANRILPRFVEMMLTRL